jgi:hypothetical protein
MKCVYAMLATFTFIFIALFGWMLKWDKYESKEENWEVFDE